MPEEVEKSARATFNKRWDKNRFFRGKMNKKYKSKEEAEDAYVYGTLRKTGWKPSHQK